MSVSQLASTWTNLAIKKKLFVSFGLLVAIIAVTSVLSFRTISVIEKDIIEYSRDVEVAAHASEIEIHFAESEKHVMSFVDTANEHDLEKAIAHRDKLFTEVEALEHIVHNPKVKEKLAELKDKADLYYKDLDRLAVLEHEVHEKISHDLEPAAKQIDHDLELLMKQGVSERNIDLVAKVASTETHIMKAEIGALSFIADRDPAAAEVARKEFAAVEAAMNVLEASVADAGNNAALVDMRKSVKAYATAFGVVHDDLVEIYDLSANEMAEAATVVMADAEAIKAIAVDAEEKVRAEVMSLLTGSRMTNTIAGIAGLAAGLALALFLGNSISSRILKIVGSMRQIADGDLTAEVPYTEQKEEVGAMAKALLVFRENSAEAERLRAEQAKAAEREEEAKRQLLREIADNLDSSVGEIAVGLASAAEEMTSTAQSLTALADQTNSQASEVSNISNSTMANVQTVSSGTEEMSYSIKEIQEMTAQGSTITGDVIAEASTTRNIVDGLAERVGRINTVFELIDDIASQTNLLALNATIEAARAGEAGKGFAVVATEVKSLADQTARATEEISKDVSAIEETMKEAKEAIGKVETKISSMTEVTNSVAAAVEEQGAATSEIAERSDATAGDAKAVGDMAQELSSAAQESQSAASTVLEAAQELASNADNLQRQVTSVVEQLRAG